MDEEENVRSSKDLPLPVWLQNYVKDVIQKTRLMESEMLQVVSQYVSTNEDNSDPFKEESGDLAIEAIGKFHRILSTVTTDLKHQSDVVTNELKSRFPKRHQEINHKINSSKSKLGSIEQLATEGDITTPYLPSVSTFARLNYCKRAESPLNESSSPTNHSSVKNKNQRKGITTSSYNEYESENASNKSVFEFETQALNLAIDENIFEDSQPQPQNQNDTDSENTSASISSCQLPVAKTDQKLSPEAPFVPVDKLTDSFISSKIADNKKHISTTVDDTSGTDSDEDEDDDLAKALKKLKSFNAKLEQTPLKQDTNVKKTKEAKVSEVRTPVNKRKRVKKSIDKEVFRRDRGSSSDTDSFPEDFESQSAASLRRNILSSPQRSVATSSRLGANDSSGTGSDTDCYLDGEAELQSDLENSAKKEVLKNTRMKKLVNDDGEAIKSSKEKAERGKNNYFTPAVCRIPNRIDSEASDSDASSSSAKSVSLLTQFPLEPENPRPLSKRTNVIRSDSSGSDSGSHKSKLVNKEKEGPDIINVESDSDDDEDVLHKRKRSITKPVEDITTDEDVKENLVFTPSPKSKADTKKAIKKETPDKLFRIFTQSKNEKRRKVITIPDSDSDNEDFQVSKRMRYSQSPAALNKFKSDYDSDIEEVEVEKKSPSDVYNIEDSDDDLESPRNKGRRNIRGIMTNNTLTRETQVAELEEEERKLRLAEKQAKFNASLMVLSQTPLTIDDRMGPPVQELILDIDTSSKMPIVSVDISIAEKLKPHQVNGVKFMWETCFESVEQYNKPNYKGSGCILAHCMGLGKTLQTVTFVHTVLTAKPLSVRTALIVTPLNTVVNWQNEFRMWLKRVKKPIKVHALFDTKNKEIDIRVGALERWEREGGVGIMHYDYFRSLVTTATNSKKNINDSHLEAIEKCLLDPGPDLIICDEGHLLKNHESGMSVAINRIQTKRRVVLTGTPLQNNLMEYHTMMQFVKPSLLGSRKEFANRFANPIKNGQHKDSGRLDVTIMKRRAHVLHKLLDGCVQRLDYTTLLPYLPEKQEYTVILNVSPIQKKLYNHYLDLLGGAGGSGFAQDRISSGKFLGDFAAVSRIWSHPLNLNLLSKKTKVQKLAGKGKKLKDDGEDFDDEVENINDTFDDVTGDSRKSVRLIAKTLAKKETEKFEKEVGQWWSSFFNGTEDMKKIEHGSKCVILMQIIKASVSQGDKILVFSQYLYSLDMIEELLSQLDKEAMGQMWKDSKDPRKADGNRWRKGVDYFRIDGSVKGADRQRDCDSFNKESSRSKLFLISTRAGGLGINLVGANRVVLFDASFNPSNDMQGIFRVFRFGQKKKCFIYRLIARRTMEEKVYNRQVVKLSLAGRVVDEHQINRHFSNDELVKMYNKIEDDVEDAPVPSVPKDSVLANLLMSETYQNIIYKYLEHDSLLTNQVDEKLTDEERRLAWQEFEAEKKGRVPIPDVPSGFSPFDDIVNLDGAEGYDYNDMMVGNDYPSYVEVLPLFTSGISQGEGETIIRRSIEKLYPNQTESEKDLFCTKVNGDLRIFQRYSDNPGATSSLSGGLASQLSNLKDKISSYLTIPNFLRRNVSSVGSTPFMKPLAAKHKQRKPNTTRPMYSDVNTTPVPPRASTSTASYVLPNRVSSSGLLRSNSPGSRIMNPVQPSMFRSGYGYPMQPQQPKYFQNMANRVGENVGSAAAYRDRPSIPGYAGARNAAIPLPPVPTAPTYAGIRNAPIPLPPVPTAPAYAGIRNAPIPLPPVPTATSSMGGVVSTPKVPALSQSKSNGGRRKDGF